ncbi:MAG: AAA family ATPase [Methanobacteriota archaeon]|nr:MAG: AAA family ATPase [Euryarchaeota archaeon]
MEKTILTDEHLSDSLMNSLRVLLIGGGETGLKLLDALIKDPVVTLVAVIDLNTDAPAMVKAREKGVFTSNDYTDFIRDESLDIIINATNDQNLLHTLRRDKLPKTVLINKNSALLIWTTVDENQKRLLLSDLLHPTKGKLKSSIQSEFIIGETEKMREIMNMVVQVAPTPTTVLIQGESGTGKELIARMIHEYSPWRSKPLITVNCTAFSSTLIESELFGYKKGAFTGAVSDRIGLLELADEGTIFLDEVGDMPLDMQAKILRFLQSGEIRAIGDFKTKKVKVRIIAATNRNLEKEIQNGNFRSDLYYRLNAFTIYTPPLRERIEDIPQLAYHFLHLANEKVKKNIRYISPLALNAMVRYPWPGNIRELKNTIERAVVLATGEEIELSHLPRALHTQQFSGSFSEEDLKDGLMALKNKIINHFEYDAICRYLEMNNGNITRAARAAKVPRRTFQRLMAKHNISSDTFKEQGTNSIPEKKTLSNLQS